MRSKIVNWSITTDEVYLIHIYNLQFSKIIFDMNKPCTLIKLWTLCNSQYQLGWSGVFDVCSVHFVFVPCAQNTTHKTQFQLPDAAAEELNGIKKNNLFPLVFCLCCFPSKFVKGSRFSELPIVFNQPMDLLVNNFNGKHIIPLWKGRGMKGKIQWHTVCHYMTYMTIYLTDY